MWIMLLTIYPVGLILMWKYNKHNIVVRVLLTALLFFSIPLYHMAMSFGQLTQNILTPFTQGAYSQDIVNSQDENKIEFKNISIQNQLGLGMVQGEVINHDNKVHSFTILIGFYDKDKKLLCTANGSVENLQPNSSKVFQAISQQYPINAAYQKAQVDTLIN